ncbi:SGNH/GDSL hydrolase family protein [Caulobacter hibisci]|uniref:SGNH/GDSL hydrolase family protein n=1 Tax=Caulobacter hibisci TaxID=2035993 RepID=A0ABS0SZL1_9CAUL|nr:SGNH/GDSL hydrolase family protein [Caulobacter hibisci]MBI1684984.1 SGNH/GDSL hydrolase family protein [Caulobacter hibisci]
MMLGRSIRFGVLLIGVMVAGLLAWAVYVAAPMSTKPARSLRALAVLAEATRPAETVVLGDSITQMGGDLDPICGPRTLNAGVQGSDAYTWRRMAGPVFGLSRPAHSIIALGTNTKATPAEFIADYRAIFDAAPRPVAIVGIWPFEASRLGAEKDRSAMLARYNAELRKLAAERGVAFIEPPTSANGLTADGIHPNGAGKAVWKAGLATACGPITKRIATLGASGR